jgi:hypothetical protein
MPQFNEDSVKINDLYVIYEDIRTPSVGDNGKSKWSLKLAMHPGNPDVPVFDAMVAAKLLASDFRGILPGNGTLPTTVATAADYDGQFTGWLIFTAGTYRSIPDLYVDNVRTDVMKCGHLIYTGQIVDALVHFYANNGKVKGIAAGLDGFSIQASRSAPQMSVGSGSGVDTSAAFGGGGAAPLAAAPLAAAPLAAAPLAAAPLAAAPLAAAPLAPAPGGQPVQATNFLPPGPAPVAAMAPAPVAEASYRIADGSVWTESQLKASGYTAEHFAALQRV